MNGLALSPLYGISLFSGIAGLDLGVERIIPKARTLCYVEGEMFGAQLLHKKMQKGLLHPAPIYSDVVSFPSVAHHFAKKVDFITAGFPCQPFSAAGSRKGTKDERWLWESILETISKVRPNFLFLENVSNLLNEWGAFDEISKSLAKIGFNLEWSNVRASEVGANHQRNRLFIFAYKTGTLDRIHLSHPHSEPREKDFQDLRRRQFNFIWEGVTITNPNSERPLKTLNRRTSPPFSSRSKEILRNPPTFTTNSNHKRRTKSYLPKISIEKGFPGGQNNETTFNHFSSKWWEGKPPFSAVCRVDDGIPDGLDRLRALGNAVVPLQASWAFYTLIQRAFNHPSKS